MVYSEGCKITESLPDWDADKVVLGDPAKNAKRIAEAVVVAKKADVVILVLGENEQTSREAWAMNHLGDRHSLDLLGNQDESGEADFGYGKADRLCCCCMGGRIRSTTLRKMSRQFWTAGIWDRKAAPLLPTFCSAITIPAESCRLRCRGRLAKCRITTIKSLRRSADFWMRP